ncbi:hypothetical protein [Streptomyces sp. A1547]|uniref:Uncharacterized protein n=1 Tax=Streptomyces sp. R33 TaxID=3238629 RepID=A0AB39YA84_9ACTN|nr:hypothetical protein [Streptomyces sp. A1547]KJY47493.1 hypothetical protein VR46_03205 [Streptomyces sp. NRRL S-444]THA32621.1 hypothetical protein E6W17_33105 [Streptomyces sp. A1547]
MTDDLADAVVSVPDVPDVSDVPDETGASDASGVSGEASPGPEPLGLVRTPTGHAGVDAHLERLADADHLTADGHVAVYEDVHRGLRDALTALDAPPVPGPYENRS